jgi:ABC-type Fe3+ transport system permease subunit
MNPALEEASGTSGATPFTTFRRVDAARAGCPGCSRR